MIKAPTIQGDYSLVWSGDPALNLPDPGEERDRVLTIARETGRWTDLVVTGQAPTVFHFKRLPKSVFDWIIGEHQHSSIYGRPLSQVEGYSLFFRCALKSIENWGEHGKFKPTSMGGVTMAPESIVDAIGRVDPNDCMIGAAILGELAQLVWMRETAGITPKS